jgi:hypothetical protein
MSTVDTCHPVGRLHASNQLANPFTPTHPPPFPHTPHTPPVRRVPHNMSPKVSRKCLHRQSKKSISIACPQGQSNGKSCLHQLSPHLTIHQRAYQWDCFNQLFYWLTEMYQIIRGVQFTRVLRVNPHSTCQNCPASVYTVMSKSI